MENSYQNSTTAQIIDAIINQLSFEGESKSDIADILLSILNQTPYEKEPSSVIAELFIKLKAKIEGESFEPFDKPYISNIAEIIKSILDETEYNNAPNSRIAELLLELKEQIEEDFTELTASGAIASFETNVSKPLVACEVDESATKIYQRGENLWNEQWTLGGYSPTNGSVIDYTDRIRCLEPIFVKPNTTYFIRFGTTASCVINAYDKDGDFIENISTGTFGANGRTFTTPDNCYIVKFSVGTAYGITYNNDISLNYPSSDTEYHAYNANSADYDVADIGNINTFIGVNNIFTDKGDISVSYLYKGQPILTNMLSSNNDGGLLGMDTENDNQEG